jgi:hypothetical protein
MSNLEWKFWTIPLALWGLYSCWYSGYQSGYADGHQTAWAMAKPQTLTEVAMNLENTDPQLSQHAAVSTTR